MGLIKAESSTASAAAPFSMADIEKQAHAIIVRAKSQAARILAEAARIGEEMKQQAQAQGIAEGTKLGFDEGMKRGQEAGHAQALDEHRAALTELVQALTVAANDLETSRRALESEASVDVLRLAVAIARKVSKRQGVADAQVLTTNVSEAMKLAVHASDVRIAVHPSQLKTLEDALPRLKLSWPTLQHVALVEDDSLAPGGCRIATGGGSIDADLDAQVDRIAADLMPDNE
jgi:flagellar assembly protein FliH